MGICYFIITVYTVGVRLGRLLLDTPERKHDASDAFTLEKLVAARDNSCATWRKVHHGIAYVCVARSASETMRQAMQQVKGLGNIPHDHTCNLQTLEKRGARKVVIALRHPLARISSGVARRLDGIWLTAKSSRNKIFRTYFHSAEEYISALRDERHKYHSAAMACTMLSKGQNFMTPVSEFYLRNSLGRAEISFVCIDSLIDGVIKTFDRWGLEHNVTDPKQHESVIFSSSNLTSVYSRFSAESIAWVERVYSADVELFERHCGSQERGENRSD